MEDRDSITKNDIWFGSEHNYADLFTETSSDTICAICSYSRHITLQCPDMKLPKCQLYADSPTTKNTRCMVLTSRGRGKRGCTNTITKCANYRRPYYKNSPICPTRMQVIALVRSGKDECRRMKLERQRVREEIEEEEKAQVAGAGNEGRGEWTQITVAVEISRRRDMSA